MSFHQRIPYSQKSASSSWCPRRGRETQRLAGYSRSDAPFIGSASHTTSTSAQSCRRCSVFEIKSSPWVGRVIPNQTINNLGYMNNWYSLKPQEDCLTTTFISSASHTTSAQVRRRFVCWNQEQPIVGLNPLQPSTTWDISETDFISSLKKFALRHPFYLIHIICIRAQSRWHFAVATKNRPLQPSLYRWFWRTS